MQDNTSLDQVCDRCRRRKIRCSGDGSSARCMPCTTAQVPCLRSTALRRNRKRKSFYENEANQERLLEQHQGNGAVEYDERRPALASAQQHRPARFAHELILQQASPRRRAERDAGSLAATPALTPTLGLQPAISTPRNHRNYPPSRTSQADPVVGHMGRLVPNDGGVSLFAGSTSGVHFVSQTEQTMQQLRLSTNQYPNSAYSLHMHSAIRLSTQEDDLSLIANIVPQIQSDAITVIEAAIDFLTPLYPAIHKPSSLPVYRQLLVGSSCKYPLVQLYQVLLLLSIGNIATASPSCTKQHKHFLCYSEFYYSLATVISARAMTVSCLETLQALILAQIYLQVSSRGAEALQLGGVATRMAQSLGLHRHSARFKMGPLETEMRRRLWGCQCTLDAFASTYHGMPRLIRAQDVDADNPTPVDHEQMSTSHIAFPLPGERSEIDYAICAFSIARTLGKALEQLYTTTDRRGGVEKIQQLQAEVDLWTRTLPSEVTDDEFLTADIDHIGLVRDHQSPPNTYSPSTQSTQVRTSRGTWFETSLGAMFLRIVKCITTIHIHRPALAFTTSHPQVLESLRTCISVSAELIRIMTLVTVTREHGQHLETIDSPEALRQQLFLSCLYPNGVHMLWQAGLTILFSKWKGQAIEPPNTTTQGHNNSLSGDGNQLVLLCASTMRNISQVREDEAPATHSGQNSNSIETCANVLEQLVAKTFPVAHPSHGSAWENSNSITGTAAIGSDRTDTRQSPNKAGTGDNGGGYAEWQEQQSPSWDLWDWPMASALNLANILDVMPFEMTVEAEREVVQ